MLHRADSFPQLQLLLDLLRLRLVVLLVVVVLSQITADVEYDFLGFPAGTGDRFQALRHLSLGIEHKLTEEEETPGFVRQRLAGDALGLELVPERSFHEIAKLSRPCPIGLEGIQLPLRRRQDRGEDLPGR